MWIAIFKQAFPKIIKGRFKQERGGITEFVFLGRALDSGKCVRILGRVLDSGTCFWILGSVLDSGMCFGFWEVFCILGNVLDSGTCFWVLGRAFGFWEVFRILGRVFGFWEVFWIVPTNHRKIVPKTLLPGDFAYRKNWKVVFKKH